MPGSEILVPAPQFAQMLKEKYPKFASVEDALLIKAFVTKNPKYRVTYEGTNPVSVSWMAGTGSVAQPTAQQDVAVPSAVSTLETDAAGSAEIPSADASNFYAPVSEALVDAQVSGIPRDLPVSVERKSAAGAVKKCISCTAELPASSKFCPECGTVQRTEKDRQAGETKVKLQETLENIGQPIPAESEHPTGGSPESLLGTSSSEDVSGVQGIGNDQQEGSPAQATKQCAKCMAEVFVSSKFCPACGMFQSPKRNARAGEMKVSLSKLALESAISCPACSEKNPESSKFCCECGYALSAKSNLDPASEELSQSTSIEEQHAPSAETDNQRPKAPKSSQNPVTAPVYSVKPPAFASLDDVRRRSKLRAQEGSTVKSIFLAVGIVILIAIVGLAVWRTLHPAKPSSKSETLQPQTAALSEQAPTQSETRSPETAGQLSSNSEIQTPIAESRPLKLPKTARTPVPETDKPESRIQIRDLKLPEAIPEKIAKVEEQSAPTLAPVRNDSLTTIVKGSHQAVPVIAAPKVVAPPPVVTVDLSARVAAGLRMRRVAPKYPVSARTSHISGVVVLRVLISKDGSVMNLQAIKGPTELVQSAIDAVRQWKYKPYVVNGASVQVRTEVMVDFDPSVS